MFSNKFVHHPRLTYESDENIGDAIINKPQRTVYQHQFHNSIQIMFTIEETNQNNFVPSIVSGEHN